MRPRPAVRASGLRRNGRGFPAAADRCHEPVKWAATAPPPPGCGLPKMSAADRDRTYPPRVAGLPGARSTILSLLRGLRRVAARRRQRSSAGTLRARLPIGAHRVLTSRPRGTRQVGARRRRAGGTPIAGTIRSLRGSRRRRVGRGRPRGGRGLRRGPRGNGKSRARRLAYRCRHGRAVRLTDGTGSGRRRAGLARRCRRRRSARFGHGGGGRFALEHHRPPRLLDNDNPPALDLRTSPVCTAGIVLITILTRGGLHRLGRLGLALYEGGLGLPLFFRVLRLGGTFGSGRGLIVAHSQLVKSCAGGLR